MTALGGLGLAGLAPSASAAPLAKPYDFNGDGYQDLAIGSPNGTVGTKTTAGFVSVIYGSSAGLNTAKKKVISQDSAGVSGTAEAGDHFGHGLASGDFDADGYADLAIGTPDEDTPTGANAGLVTVVWGTPSGLGDVSDSFEELDAGEALPNNRWGEYLSAGMIEASGAPKLFVTVPGMSIFKFVVFGGAESARAAGTTRSPKAAGSQVVPRGKKEGASTKSLEDVTNSWVANGDVTGDGIGDAVYAWYDADWAEPSERRGFVVYPGTADGGLNPDLATSVLAEVTSVAVGDFDGEGHGDVAVGQPNGIVGGRITVYKGSATGVDATNRTSVHQGTADVPGDPVTKDYFGLNVAAGDVNKDGKADLAVGTPYDEVGTVVDAGSAYVLFGSATGLTGAGSQQVTQDTEGVGGGSETNDQFGFQVTLLDNNNDGAGDLTVGAPRENGTDGAITWIKGGTTGVLPVTGSLWLGTGTWSVGGRNAELGRVLGR
ncbi:FG-GAP-like repeat-containing protein [Actinomadura sp. HBU206391]|uniref:FG-GAP-like repeat-containing protein n=1 Tax=Actinomadura sp. HBU206391 TaxID=2731692 RepID=UPI00164EF53E|nr:FG-GAP-like repeat-containing protein [Actinomadura sp. HBU206391]MBC6457144.1 VCBS repeat-containing protein [Actinomadura sp. HBU206391]